MKTFCRRINTAGGPNAERPIATRIPLIVNTAVQRLCAIATIRLALPTAVHRFVTKCGLPSSPSAEPWIKGNRMKLAVQLQQVKAWRSFGQSKWFGGPFI